MSEFSHVYDVFFSSRRRHTRCLSDWSSDVCSSDLMLWRYRQVHVSVVDKKHQADQRKPRELKRNHNPARQQRRTALAHVTGAEQPLHHKLIRAVAGGSEETAAGPSRTEAVGPRKECHGGRQPEIEDREFMERTGHRYDVRPASWNLVQNHKKANHGAGYVQGHLHDLGPNDRGHPALEGVEKRQDGNQRDGSDFVGAEHDGDDNGDREDPHAFGQRARDQEYRGGEFADSLAETAAHQFVRSEHLTAEVVWYQQEANHDASQQIS